MTDIRLAWLSTHPIQYQAPLLRAIAASSGIDLTVLYFSDFSTRAYVDREFGRAVKWDVPLLDGYRHEFLASTGEQVTGTTFFRPRIAGLAEKLTPKRFDAVLIQGWNHYGYVEAAWRARRAGLKVLLRCEATDHVAASRGLKRRLRELLIAQVLAHTDHVLAIGTHNRDFFLKRSFPPERIGLAPYCVDNDYFRECARVADLEKLRTELGIQDGRPVILYASKLTARKNADLLLQAYAALPEPCPYLLFVGDGELRGDLERMAADRHLVDVRFLGFRNQSELPGYYALADIFVLPSVNETWGLVVNEAMNAGCAVIVTDQVGAAVDLVRYGENGFVVTPHDETALSAALTNCLANRRFQQMGMRSAEIIQSWGIAENVSGIRNVLGLGERHEI